MTLAPADADQLRRLRSVYQQAQAETDQARMAYYALLVELADTGAMQHELADVLDISRVRVQQLLTQARAALG